MINIPQLQPDSALRLFSSDACFADNGSNGGCFRFEGANEGCKCGDKCSCSPCTCKWEYRWSIDFIPPPCGRWIEMWPDCSVSNQLMVYSHAEDVRQACCLYARTTMFREYRKCCLVRQGCKKSLTSSRQGSTVYLFTKNKDIIF